MEFTMMAKTHNDWRYLLDWQIFARNPKPRDILYGQIRGVVRQIHNAGNMANIFAYIRISG
jgi:hypothetical protein